MIKGEIKVLIADDHAIIREGLKRIISFEEDIEIVGEAEDGDKVISLLERIVPDVVLLDCNMPIKNGIEVLKSIKNNSETIKVIMLTIENDRNTIHAAIHIGADGYVLKDSAGTEIVNAIRMVYKGEKYIDKSLVSMLFLDIKSKDRKYSSALDKLSKREIEVLIKISKGLSNKEIGEQLFLSEKTIKNYATNLFRKIDVDDRVQATIFAIENKIEEYYKKRYSEE
ncbi:response regulator [Clostridium rhizosphaerae]|uniref:response regulator n=1 Tax=Clostridium rhizosphaerae TaxID=2803861 RepID=UPI001A9C6928|nr:response regulator transcription factor [Clostridium rhizosphaerae]